MFMENTQAKQMVLRSFDLPYFLLSPLSCCLQWGSENKLIPYTKPLVVLLIDGDYN